jgi:hypothetical protein
VASGSLTNLTDGCAARAAKSARSGQVTIPSELSHGQADRYSTGATVDLEKILYCRFYTSDRRLNKRMRPRTRTAMDRERQQQQQAESPLLPSLQPGPIPSERMVRFAIVLLLLLPSVGGVSPPADDEHSIRERRVTSFYRGGRFDGFATPERRATPRPLAAARGLTVGRSSSPALPTIRTNTTLLTAGRSCAWKDACGANGAWVEVLGSCGSSGDNSTQQEAWWVGLFPADAPQIRHVSPSSLSNTSGLSPILSPPFVLPAPLKFELVSCVHNLSKAASGTNPGTPWWVPRTASGPLVFVLLSGGASASSIPVERARSAPLKFRYPAAPMHIRLAHVIVGDVSTPRMRVSWTSSTRTSPKLYWGPRPDQLTNVVEGSSSGSYSPDSLCGEPARTLGWWEPGFMLSATISHGGSVGTRVFYAVSSGGVRSPTHSFLVTGVGPQHMVAAVLTADMGATTPDFVQQHWAETTAFASTRLMASLVDRGFRGSPVSLAFNVGDLSYATGYLGKVRRSPRPSWRDIQEMMRSCSHV